MDWVLIMKIVVADQDRTNDLGSDIRARALELKKRSGREAPPEISSEIGALALKKARSDADYLAHFVRLLRYRDACDTYDFDIPRKPGLSGRMMAGIKKILWKLMRYQHDRIAFRQNLINGLFTNAIEFEIAERLRINDELSRRLEKMEAAMQRLLADQKTK